MCNIRLPIIIIIIICCQLIGCKDIRFPFDGDESEGNHCRIEGNLPGVCKNISECPSRLLEVQKGKRTSNSTERCGFDHLTEIVCCSIQPIPFEGDYCRMDNGHLGICEKLTACPSRLKEEQDGKRTLDSTGNCGIDHLTDIVCCPLRPAEKACYFKNRIEYAYNGLPAHQDEFPFMAALGYTTYKTGENASSITYTCGGSLISSQHVLTAAHCVSNIQGMVPVEVRLGNVNINNNEGAQRIPISDIVSHPQYRRSMNYNDIAILKLKFQVNIEFEVMPICLQTRSVAVMGITSHTDVVMAGWGRTSLESEKQSDNLMKSPNLRIVNKEECNKWYTEFTRRLPHGITDSMICVADPNTTRMADACPGDSGGPLLLPGQPEVRLIGITAFGSFCGTTTPGVYTAIYPFLDWIEEHVWPTQPNE